MQRHERLTKLFEVILEEESVTVDELVARLGVSAATVRRDLDHLAGQQLITRTHGGAVASPHSSDIPIRYGPGAKLSQEKRRIAASAADQVRPGDIIGLNGGTTTTELARELAVREELRAEASGEQIVIITNAVNIATELAVRPHLRVVLTGGVVRSMSFELVGPFASPVIDSVSIDTLFLGVDALTPKGAFTAHDGEAAINGRLAAQARRVVVIADSTKLRARAFARICPLSEIDQIITDDRADPQAVARFREAGIEVVLV